MIINGNKIKAVRYLKYLVSVEENNGSSVIEIETRISEIRKVTRILNALLWRQNIIIGKTKVTSFNTLTGNTTGHKTAQENKLLAKMEY